MHVIGTDDSEPAEPRPGSTIRRLVKGDEMSALHLRMEPEHTNSPHSHPNEQIGYVLTGAVTITLPDGGERVVEAGESYVLEAGVEHGVANRGDVPFESIEIFAPPRPLDYWD